MSESTPATTQINPADYTPTNGATALLLLQDGTAFWGQGFGDAEMKVGEVCFNTSMTGYQEIMTDPSYAGQLVTFTFPHIGNVGCNPVDVETDHPFALGMIVRNPVTAPSNWRQTDGLTSWMQMVGLPGISGIDTRALTRRIRDKGAPTGVLVHAPDGQFDMPAICAALASWPGLAGMDLASKVSTDTAHGWQKGSYDMAAQSDTDPEARFKVVALDYGVKQHILRCLRDVGCAVEVMPAASSAADILAAKPDGIFLSNGPGDPAATASAFAADQVAELVASDTPIFGICIGHQLLAHAFGAKTYKMETGHRGANHPVRDLQTGQIEITSQNHGFVVDPDSLPEDVEITHISLFDGSVEGLRHKTKPVFCVQYHPESSPGPHDSRYLFNRFTDLMQAHQK